MMLLIPSSTVPTLGINGFSLSTVTLPWHFLICSSILPLGMWWKELNLQTWKKQNLKLRLFSHFLILFNPIRQINIYTQSFLANAIYFCFLFLWPKEFMGVSLYAWWGSPVYIEINISNPNSNTDHQIINLVVIRQSRLFAQSLPTLKQMMTKTCQTCRI